MKNFADDPALKFILEKHKQSLFERGKGLDKDPRVKKWFDNTLFP